MMGEHSHPSRLSLSTLRHTDFFLSPLPSLPFPAIHSNAMPDFGLRGPRNHNSLRANAARRILAETRENYPAFLCQRLRREERVLMAMLDSTPAGETDRYLSILTSLRATRMMIFETILYPRRPGSPPMKGPRGAVRTDEILLAQVSEPGNGLKTGQSSEPGPESAGL